jgi:hypothetical protein
MTVREDRELRLQPRPASVRESRSFVRSVLGSWGLPGLCDDAGLLVSELASNAVLYARTPLTLTVSWRRRTNRVRVTVHDESTVPPCLREHDVSATTGRGLQIVAAVAHASGVVPSGTGKDVWFELAPDAGDHSPTRDA